MTDERKDLAKPGAASNSICADTENCRSLGYAPTAGRGRRDDKGESGFPVEDRGIPYLATNLATIAFSHPRRSEQWV